MKLVIVAALVVAIALVGSRRSFVRLRLPLGIENLFLTGAEYVLVGLLLGGTVLNKDLDLKLYALPQPPLKYWRLLKENWRTKPQSLKIRKV